jgi:3-hydroxyisobutyrate dehydrogenase
MADRLVDAGHSVVIADIRKVTPPPGAAATIDVGAAVSEADVVISMLPTSAALLDASAKAMPQMQRGATWIDMASNAPDALASRGTPLGVGVLDAPVGGGPGAARSGHLAVYVGGDRAVFERHRGVLRAMADPERMHHVGAAGNGYLTKLLINLIWFSQAIAAAEALFIAQRQGIELGVMHQALVGSAVAGRFVDHDLAALLRGDYLTTFGLQGCYDELVTIGEIAKDMGTPFTVSAAVTEVYRQALDAFGPVDGELMAVAYLESQAQFVLRSNGTS